jgi:hypothetical protein
MISSCKQALQVKMYLPLTPTSNGYRSGMFGQLAARSTTDDSIKATHPQMPEIASTSRLNVGVGGAMAMDYVVDGYFSPRVHQLQKRRHGKACRNRAPINLLRILRAAVASSQLTASWTETGKMRLQNYICGSVPGFQKTCMTVKG